MHELTERARRSVALAALTVACVVMGPAPQIVAALERIYAVAVVPGERRRRRSPDLVRGADLAGRRGDHRGSRRRRSGPPGRRPASGRP